MLVDDIAWGDERGRRGVEAREVRLRVLGYHLDVDRPAPGASDAEPCEIQTRLLDDLRPATHRDAKAVDVQVGRGRLRAGIGCWGKPWRDWAIICCGRRPRASLV